MNPDAARLLDAMEKRGEREETAFGEQRVAGVEAQEQSTTTLPMNSRFAFVRNGALRTPGTVDTEITHNSPVYDIPLAADDTWVVGGTDRNAYIPGFDSESGIAFQVSGTPPADRLLPPSVDLLEMGYATLFDQALTGVPNEDFTYDKEGAVLHIEPKRADLRIYKAGTVAVSLPRDDWVNDPFDQEQFDWDPTKYALLRQRGDLYGAGGMTNFLRIRDMDNEPHLVKLGTLAIRDEPLLRFFNAQMHLRVEAASSVSGSPTASLGPIEYHNRFEGDPINRSKPSRSRGVNVVDSTGDTDWTVLRLYRVDITRREAANLVTSLFVANGQDTNVMARTVHRNNINPGTFNVDDDSNWIAPGDSVVRETAMQQFDAPSDSISIKTFTDDDGVTKVHGEKELLTAITGTGGNRATTRERGGQSPLSELKYLALLGQSNDTTKDIDLIEVEFDQRW